VRITDTVITSGELPACNVRLQREGASPSDRPLLEWVADYDAERTPKCSGIAPSGNYDLSGPWPSARTRLELRASPELHPTDPGELLAYLDLGVDDDPPAMSWPDTPDWVPGGTRVKVIPEWTDLSGVWGTGTNITDDQGTPYVFEQQGGGTVVVPAGRTIIVDEYLTDAVGNSSHGRKLIHGLPSLSGPAVTASPTRTGGETPKRTTARGCEGARPAALTAVTWAPRTRRLQVSGCRIDRGSLQVQVQVQVQRRGRTSTHAYGLAAGGLAFSRTIHLGEGARPVRARVGRSRTWGAWHRASKIRRG
jgi:hypothetical protein